MFLMFGLKKAPPEYLRRRKRPLAPPRSPGILRVRGTRRDEGRVGKITVELRFSPANRAIDRDNSPTGSGERRGICLECSVELSIHE